MPDSNITFSGRSVVVVYDGSWMGLLTSIFDIYEKKWNVTAWIRQSDSVQKDVFATEVSVTTDSQKAMRVWNGLLHKIPLQSALHLYQSYLSELPGIEIAILACVKFYFSKVENPHLAYGNPDVLKIAQTAKIVHREKHRMEAFVRLQRTSEDLYYAGIEPDFNVLPLISKHFKNRYADQSWLIYDIKRKYGIYYDLNQVEEVTLDLSDEKESNQKIKSVFHDSETLYQELWLNYFKHVNISERRNIKLHLQHVPKRYWKHLIEKKMSN
jgi:probable DNA metabolism protein